MIRRVYECSICGAIRKEETLRMIQGKTCSKTCSSIKGYLSGNRKPTDIEQKLASTLDELGIEYMTQKPLLGITIADVFIFPNVAIFADGEYWHNLEGQKASDAEKTKRLRKRGYVVLRLDGATILKNDEELKNKVTEAYGKRKIKKQL